MSEDIEKPKAEKSLSKWYFIGGGIGMLPGLLSGNGILLLIGAFGCGIFAYIIRKSFFTDEDQKESDDYFIKLANADMEKKKNEPIIYCPTCHNATVEKISTGRKAGYVAVTGILAPAFKTVRSQFECKTCGYKW